MWGEGEQGIERRVALWSIAAMVEVLCRRRMSVNGEGGRKLGVKALLRDWISKLVVGMVGEVAGGRSSISSVLLPGLRNERSISSREVISVVTSTSSVERLDVGLSCCCVVFSPPSASEGVARDEFSFFEPFLPRPYFLPSSDQQGDLIQPESQLTMSPLC